MLILFGYHNAIYDYNIYRIIFYIAKFIMLFAKEAAFLAAMVVFKIRRLCVKASFGLKVASIYCTFQIIFLCTNKNLHLK